MKKNKPKKQATPVVSGDKHNVPPQEKNTPADSAAAADVPAAECPAAVAPVEETSRSGIDMDAEFAKRSEELTKEAERVFEAQRKLKLDQEKLELAQDACKQENERLETWRRDLLAKEKALRAREIAVADAEKKVENDFAEERTKFNDEQARQREALVSRLKQDETEWQSGFDTRRRQQIEDLQKEIDEQRKTFLEWKTEQCAALAEREKKLADSEKEHSELLAKIENMELEQRRLRQEKDRLKRREEAITKEVDARVTPAIAAAQEIYASEISALKDRIAALEKERSELQRKFDNLARILDRTGENPEVFLQELTGKIALYDKQLEEGLSRADKVPDIIVQRDNTIKQLRMQYDTLSSEYVALSGQQAQEAKLQADLRRVRGELEEANITLAEWEGERKRRAAATAQDAASHEVSIRTPDPELVKTIRARGRGEEDISELVWLEHIHQKMKACDTPFPRRILYSFHTALKNAEFSPLTVLSGVSGTGKSKLPELYANFGGINFISVPVQPNWDCRESLLGFFNSLSGTFEATPLMKFLAQTQLWCKDYVPANLGPEDQVSDNGLKDTMSIVLLDEMNLAHIELYFADFLSKLEERRGRIENIPALKIQITDTQDYSLPMERNVLWIGTMNQDETTKSLSDKVLDRSAIIDFPRPLTFNRRKKSSLTEGEFAPAPLIRKETWEGWNSSRLTHGQNPLFSDDDDKIIEKYKKIVEDINGEMATAGRALGHRVWQSIEMYMANHPLVRFHLEQRDQAWKDALEIAFEDQLVQKIMPKLRGVDTASPCLNNIRQILGDHHISPALCKDFEQAKSDFNDGQFIWSSSNYFSEENDLTAVAGIDLEDYHSKTREGKVASPPASEPSGSASKPVAVENGSPAPAPQCAEVPDPGPAPQKPPISRVQGKHCPSEQELRDFINTLDAEFEASEIEIIVTGFKTKEKLIAEWTEQRRLSAAVQLVFFSKDLNNDGKLAKKLIGALKKADL